MSYSSVLDAAFPMTPFAPLVLALAFLGACSASDATEASASQVVEAACGQCQFDLPGDTCDLAVRFDGHAYFVDGTNIDDHGDAHDTEGFCNAIRSAHVEGQLEGDRFQVTSFTLLP